MAQMAEKFLLSRFSRFSCAALVGLAIFTAVRGDHLSTLAAILAAALVWTSAGFQPERQRQPWQGIHQALFLVLLGVLAASLWLGPWSLAHWLYAVPLLAFALFPLALGGVITLTTIVMVMVATQWATGVPERHQFISALLLTAALSCVLIFLREYKSRQLAPLRRTDELTQAASRDYLSADLHKEIQRSEREGTDMAVMMIGLDTHLSDSNPDADIRSILPRIGRFLHSQLRDFDTYYRVADLQFLVILPGVATADAAVRAEHIRKGLRALLRSHELDLTVSAGIAGLNIGDNADSLQQSVANALRRAQQQGGNRVQSYSTWSHAPRARTDLQDPAP